MIDMHSHILPNIDDGSKSVEETFNMINEAKNAGFTDIVITSHFLLDYYQPTPEEIDIWKNKLQEILDSKNIRIKLHSGMEIYVLNKLKDLIDEGRLLTIGKSKYMLIELPINASINYLDHLLFSLQSMNIIPIIAHPERYIYMQEKPELAEEYISKGALLQCNYGSILGSYGREATKTIKLLLKRNQVHFLGSDCHKEGTIYTLIPKAIKKIKKIIGEDEFYRISTKNPEKVLKNEEW